MNRNNKGSVTVMAFVVMLFISLYGALIFGTAARKYQVQSMNINTIINSYKFQGGDSSPNGKMISKQELEHLYENVGGTVIEYVRS